MAMHRVAVISDTHGLLRPEVARLLSCVELILHGGDFASRQMLDQLRQQNPSAEVIAVRGNCDREWAEELPAERFFTLYGKKIYMIHDKKEAGPEAAQADIVIFGHSHKYKEKFKGKTLWLNPGSCGQERAGKPASMAVLMIDDETGWFAAQKIDLSAGTYAEGQESGLLE